MNSKTQLNKIAFAQMQGCYYYFSTTCSYIASWPIEVYVMFLFWLFTLAYARLFEQDTFAFVGNLTMFPTGLYATFAERESSLAVFLARACKQILYTYV